MDNNKFEDAFDEGSPKRISKEDKELEAFIWGV